jgi:hypothetical protein
MAEGSDSITGKFDFYDILGYLVPGLVFLGLVTLPFGLIKGMWPSSSLTSTVLYLVGAHILGHILQGFLRAWEKTLRVKGQSGKMVKPRNPSSILLDDADKSLKPFLPKIEKLARKFWGIPKEDKSWDSVQDADRDAAFLQARNLLLQAKKQSYFEQFQGKYALMGGIAAALLLIALYYAGWWIGLGCHPEGKLPHCAWVGFAIFLLVFIVFLFIVHSEDKTLPHVIMLILLAIGSGWGGVLTSSTPARVTEGKGGNAPPCQVCYIAKPDSGEDGKGQSPLDIEHKATFMVILALVAFAMAIRCYGAYKAFAREFAMGVWRDFANYDLVTESAKSAGGEDKNKGKTD